LAPDLTAAGEIFSRFRPFSLRIRDYLVGIALAKENATKRRRLTGTTKNGRSVDIPLTPPPEAG
jgi:hypothetical protein